MDEELYTICRCGVRTHVATGARPSYPVHLQGRESIQQQELSEKSPQRPDFFGTPGNTRETPSILQVSHACHEVVPCSKKHSWWQKVSMARAHARSILFPRYGVS